MENKNMLRLTDENLDGFFKSLKYIQRFRLVDEEIFDLFVSNLKSNTHPGRNTKNGN